MLLLIPGTGRALMPGRLTPDRIPWQTLSIEAVVVVLSVLLALGVDSWRQSRAERHLALEALQGIVDEARSNCDRIRVHQAYHAAVVSGHLQPEGIRIGLLRNDAWDVAKSIGAPPHLPHDVVASVASINALQGDHRAYVKAYLQSLFAMGLRLEEGERWHAPGERIVIAELVRTQDELVDAYLELAVSVERHHPGDVSTARICIDG